MLKHLLLQLTMLSISLTAFAQQKVTGNVKDSSGEPIIGASISIKGNQTVGSITDFDGNFTLDVPEHSTLLVSYIGYGAQRKGDVTSSVSSIKSEDFVKGAVKDVGQLLQGFPGMLKKCTFRIVLVDRHSGVGDQPMKVNKVVNYAGKKSIIKL